MSDGEKITTGVEFVDPIKGYDWTTDGVKPPGGEEAIIYKDKSSNTYCRALILPKGFAGGTEPLAHEFDEIVFIASGSMINKRTGYEYNAGTVAVFPAGTKHGPMAAPKGALTIEFRHYRKG